MWYLVYLSNCLHARNQNLCSLSEVSSLFVENASRLKFTWRVSCVLKVRHFWRAETEAICKRVSHNHNLIECISQPSEFYTYKLLSLLYTPNLETNCKLTRWLTCRVVSMAQYRFKIRHLKRLTNCKLTKIYFTVTWLLTISAWTLPCSNSAVYKWRTSSPLWTWKPRNYTSDCIIVQEVCRYLHLISHRICYFLAVYLNDVLFWRRSRDPSFCLVRDQYCFALGSHSQDNVLNLSQC